jgi:type IV pilus assembly protein PilN
MPRINLLPWREADRKRKRQDFIAGSGAALLVAAVAAFVVNLEMQSAISRQEKRNDLLQTEITKLDQQIAEILDLEEKKERLRARINVIEQLQRSRPEVVHLFDQLVKTVPDGLYLTSVKQDGRKIQLKGMAQSSTRVSTYMRNIDASEWLQDPALEVVESKGSGEISSQFTLYATQIQPASEPTAEELKAKARKDRSAMAARGPKE